ncbi:MAG TPA: ATP-binding protein [Phycisphaerae bacterium]|nr:ATP-binding protein [Phycisphaerae bacterium]
MHPLKIGNVITVDGDGIEVLLTKSETSIEHEGQTYRLGRIGSYVTIPMDDKTVIGFVTRVGRQDTTTVDVEPEMIMSVMLLGTIQNRRFTGGVNEYPVIGDDVWLAIQKDFELIFGSFDQLLSGSDHPASFSLGHFALNPDFEVRVLGKEFFSKHAAILGNSGSGKSCTIAKILQETMQLNNAQVILFDLHGEYAAAFSDEDGEMDRNVVYLGEHDLVLPYWMLRYAELERIFVDHSDQKAASSQVAFLKMALQRLKSEAAEELGLSEVFSIDTPIYFSLERLLDVANNFNEARYVINTERLAFVKLAERSLEPAEQDQLMWSKRCRFNQGNAEGEVPHQHFNSKIQGLITQIETRLNDRRFDFMLRPMEQAKRSPYFWDLINKERTPAELSHVVGRLIELMTGRTEPQANLVIVDLSGIPFEVVDICVAVLTRMVFDFNFWCSTSQRHPVVLAYEEAHNYIPRRPDSSHFACEAVERVAKEGRKYGVSAVVVSQRPSELSETVLSQCNNMIVMRMNNPDDQDYILRVVSDQFSSLMRMLPILRPGEGFVVGDSVLMPLRTLIELPLRQPSSGDVDFFARWSRDTPPCQVNQVLDRWWRQERSDNGDKDAEAKGQAELAGAAAE